MAGGAPGGSLGLLHLIEEHRRAARADFRERFSLSLDDVGDAFTYGEAIDLVEALIDSAGSRLHAAVRRWEFPMSRLERDMRVLAESYLERHRDSKKRAQPFDLGWPYPAQELVTAEELEDLTQQLIRRSALADR